MRRTHLNSRNRLHPLNIDIEDEGGEWVLENTNGCSWQHSLEECVNLWLEYVGRVEVADYQIRNVNTGEIIPCSAIV